MTKSSGKGWHGPREKGTPSPPFKGEGKKLTKKGREIKDKVRNKSKNELDKKYTFEGNKDLKFPKEVIEITRSVPGRKGKLVEKALIEHARELKENGFTKRSMKLSDKLYKLSLDAKQELDGINSKEAIITFPKGYTEYHGTSQPIKGKTLKLGQMMGGGDSGGIFTTNDMMFAKAFASGKYKALYKVDLSNKKVLNLSSNKGIKLAEGLIGKSYTDIDGEKATFTKQDFDFLFPRIEGKRHGADWGTFTNYSPLFEKEGYDGLRIWENRSDNRKVVSTVMFKGGLKIKRID